MRRLDLAVGRVQDLLSRVGSIPQIWELGIVAIPWEKFFVQGCPLTVNPKTCLCKQVSLYPRISVPGFRVKEGLSCVLFCVVALRKTRNLALPCLENPV